MAQGVLPFQYEAEKPTVGTTALGGLPVYLDLVKGCGLVGSIRSYLRVAGAQGWLDIQMVLALVFLNLAGGDCLEDLERLEADAGFRQVMQEIERSLLDRRERRSLKSRWRRERQRVLPSPSSVGEWLVRWRRHLDPKRRRLNRTRII